MQNYHKHTWFSNTFVADCPTPYEAYIERANDLGHKVISSVEHGFQSNYYEPYELVQENNEKLYKKVKSGEITEDEYNKRKLKFVFGAEAYWVKDRKKEYPSKDKNGEILKDKKTGEVKYVKDRSNCHIVLLAKNEEGRRDINEALSDANIDGYYFQPRLDLELLMKIKPENVMVTSACVAYWKYDDIEEITVQLHKHFGDNFFLEVQYHNTDKQKKLNQRILELSKKYGIDIILGYDSHYIYKSDAVERDNYIKARGIEYSDDEAGWYMDYPDDTTAKNRLKLQGILNDEEIDRCMKNTDLIIEFEDLYFDKEIKLPNSYKGKSQEWKNEKLKELVYTAWDEAKKHVEPKRYKEYEEGIAYELQAIIDTNMADYFLIDKRIVERGIEKGGIITKTGRGSGVSYYVNSLLGFSNIDRFISPVKLYPDRFMSKTRILQTRSLPDLDLNLGNPEVFAEAQEEIMGGSNHAVPMISYKPLQKSSAFKLYAKSQGLDFDIANEVTDQIKKYEKALKHADSPEDKEVIDIYNFVDKKYHKYLTESKKYQGIINAKSQAPCGYLIYDGDIKREIGLIKCKSESTKKEVITTVIDGMVAERYKFVKNDLLKVDIWLTINKIFEKIGIPTYDVPTMTKKVDGDKKTWDIYSNGYTWGINQCESSFGRQCCKRYKPQNMQELTALVSALRPGFKTQLDNFLDRKPYTTGVEALDNLLTDSFHYIMYQENIMTWLGWLGVDQTETYAIIKKISKKKFKEKELAELKGRLIVEWEKNTGSEDGFEKTWSIMEAFSKYAFNASHAYSYAYDSVYGAYLKAHYPYEFYSVMLQHLSEKGDKDKVAAYKQEMRQAFGIGEGDYKFRLDNRTFVIDRKNRQIIPALSSLKGISFNTASKLYELKDNTYKSFIDLLEDLSIKGIVGGENLINLIKLNYFSEFGNINYLLKCKEIFDLFFKNKKYGVELKKDKAFEMKIDYDLIRKYSEKETPKKFMKVNMNGIVNNLILRYKDIQTKPSDVISMRFEVLGYVDIIDKKYVGYCVVTDISLENAPKLTLYPLANGNTFNVKIKKNDFKNSPLKRGNVIHIEDEDAYRDYKWMKATEDDVKKKNMSIHHRENKDWVRLNEKEWWAKKYTVC